MKLLQKWRLRKEAKNQGDILRNILKGIEPFIMSGYSGPFKILLRPDFFFELLTSIHPITHIILFERLKSVITTCGDRIFSDVVISGKIGKKFIIMKGE